MWYVSFLVSFRCDNSDATLAVLRYVLLLLWCCINGSIIAICMHIYTYIYILVNGRRILLFFYWMIAEQWNRTDVIIIQ
jgi:hypothetical protein